MKKTGRYDTAGLIEAQFEPGARGRVLKNLLGIKRKCEMDKIEAREHIRAMEERATIYDKDHCFTTVARYILHTATDSTIFQSLDL